MAPRERCRTCGSKQWHKEPSSGLIACSEGHILQNYRKENLEVEFTGQHVIKKRTIKSGAKNLTRSNADHKLYHGARARYHYFLCLQLILRKQIDALIKHWDFPLQFEVVCKDVWSLHLSLLPVPPPPEPYNFAQSNNEPGKPPVGIHDRRTSATNQKDSKRKIENPTDAPGSDDSDGAADEGHPKLRDEDSELEDLMRELSEISDSSDEETENVASLQPTMRRESRSKNKSLYETPASTVAVLVVACWILRIPVLYCDLRRVIEMYELPYLNALKCIPGEMLSHLTKHNIEALSPHYAPKTLVIHALASRLSKALYGIYGVVTPEANAAPILWRVVNAMGGTPLLYMLTKRLASILSIPLTLHSSLAQGLKRTRNGDIEHHKYENVPPEVALMAAYVIVAKMVYGLDGEERSPLDEDDPACSLPELGAYLKLLQMKDEEEANKKETIFSTEREMSIGDLGNVLTDEYLALCERALLVSASNAEEPVLRQCFPLPYVDTWDRGTDGPGDGRTRGRLTAAESRPAGDGTQLRPGERYAIWNAHDVHGAVPDAYASVMGRAARWTQVGAGEIGRVVEAYERRAVRWWSGQRRRDTGTR